MADKTRARAKINGEAVEFLCEPRQSLLECLRDILGLTGSKEGCNDGNCGACSVLLNGRVVNSCLVLGVEVDPETGKIDILRYTAVQDVGKAVHPDFVEGQIQGGTVQGIGWALYEGYQYDAGGNMLNPGFLDYKIPTATDLPMIETILVEVPGPNHPFGVRGVGETPIVPPLAAVANAVNRATGARLTDLPLTPDRILKAMGVI